MSTTKTIQQVLKLKYEPVAFRSRELAMSAARRCKASTVMLGENERYLVVCLADAAKMEKAGYEYAN